MMIAHHCFAFPDYWLEPFSVSYFIANLCNQFKLCVAVFAFITGYGFHVSKNTSFLQLIRKVMNFLAQYWFQLFLIFLPVASIGFSFSLKQILYNIFALYDNIIIFAWYVFFHCVVILTFPVVKRLLTKGPVWDLFIVLIGGYCVTVLFYFWPFDGSIFAMLLDCSIYYPVVGIGYLAARYAVFEQLSCKIKYKFPIALLLIVIIFSVRSHISVVKGFTFDVFYAPALILALSWILTKFPLICSGLDFLGKNSLHMWLFHAIFFSAYTRDVIQPLVAWSNSAIVRFLLITILSTVFAFAINCLWKWLIQILHRNKEKHSCT